MNILCIPPSTEVGVIKRSLRDMIEKGDIENTRESLINYLKELTGDYNVVRG